MIVLTVKTLDSQNHTFTVDDDITVEEFKVKIADTVNIPADTQRIIYCGRVLQDDAKLSDYDVNGKVVHLVQRPPPSANPSTTTRSSSPQPSRRNTPGGAGFRGFESGNTVYLGSMAFPSNLMESQGIVPPPPTHSLAGSRLNVARRMLRRAEAVITLLENPSARPSDIVNPDEQQDEEVTPIIEARVIVPPGNNEHIDEAMVISAVQNSLFDSGAIPLGSQVTVDSNTTNSSEGNTGSSTPEETGNGDTTQNERASGTANNSRTLAENASRTSEMSDLLTMLNQLQVRFAPFLERYRQFMVDDPVVPSENARQTQVMLSRVSEVLHFLGHAYHSLSDIIIRVRTPPPRPLLCRPILIQHSAVVQTGIPIQVEVAQFNLSTDRPNATTTSTSTNNTTTTTAATTTAASTTSTTGSGSDSNTVPTTQQQQQPPVNIRGFPFIPAASMRVQSFPIELRTTARPIGVNIPQRNNNSTSENVTSSSSTSTTTASSTTVTNTGTTTTSTSTTTDNTGFPLPNFNNSSVEFFMEVTPEGTLNGPPPEFLQSLVQMAGQIMNRVTTTTTTSSSSTTATTTTIGGDGSQQQTTTTGQNSQARGNTQTHPTTATHTRSTSRPHVHLAQQAMQGGFDPFLPCNSHHITHRRRQQQQQQQHHHQQQSQPQQPQQQQQQGQIFNLREGLQAIRNWMTNTGGASSTATTTTNTNTTTTEDEQRRNNQNTTSGDSNNARLDGNVQNLQNSMDEIYSALRTAFRQRMQNDSRRPGDNITTSTGQTSNENNENTTTQSNRTSFAGLPPNLQSLFASLPNMLQGPTIAEILQQLPPDDSTIRPGESMITDLIMLLSRNLTLLDMITLNSGNFEPLNRVSNDIQQFFMTQVLDGDTSQDGINRGVDRFMNEMPPFFQNFSRLRVRDDIDIVRSVEQLFRRRLPDIVTTAANLNSGNMRDLVNHCLNLAQLTCRLALHASANGIQGVEETFQQIVTSYMQGIPVELQNWTIMTSCANLRHFMSNLGSSDVEAYIVRNSDMSSEPERQQNAARTATAPPSTTTTTTTTTTAEPMELDVEDETTASEELEDPEPLPNVVLGSESWHNQVPEDWVPIITRDVQRQRRQNPQTPFSDAYLSGMPTKRRKIVNSTKPQGSLPQVISDSVRRAITTTGLTTVAPLEVVSQGAGNCTDVQAAYRNLLRTTVQTALRDNEDFTPERFPNASTYFKTP